MSRERFVPRFQADLSPEPFATVEEAWFWFIQAYDARQAGARIVAGAGDSHRPCEPLDILRCVDRLYRQRRLMIDHLKVMAHYGRRLSPPVPHRPRERRAHMLWTEGLDRLAGSLRSKGIIL